MPNDIRGNINTLPGPYSIYGDGNLGRLESSANPPRIVIMGTAGKGRDYQPQVFTEDSIDLMLSVFGSDGNLIQQVQEMQSKGSNAALAIRIGARPLFAMHIGMTGASPTDQEDGYWLEPFYGGTEYGTRFGVAYQKSDGRLIVEDKLTSTIVFDNDSTNPIDLGLMYVRGTSNSASGQDDIGTISPLATVAINSISVTGNNTDRVLYPGDDGTAISRMQCFEGMMKAFNSLEGFQYDYVPAPPKATLDAPFDGAIDPELVKSVGTLTLTGQPLDTETVVIDTKTYVFQTALTDVDGNVLIGADAAESLDNLIAAITLGTGAGTAYATSMVVHPTVTAAAAAGDSMLATAKTAGTAGNSIVTTETLTNGSWGGATLASGLDYVPKVLVNDVATVPIYPSANSNGGARPDKLGKVFIEYVEDRLEFYWDVDGDNIAEYWSVMDTSNYSTVSKGGNTFASGDFLEPNFAYALGYHCQRTTFESHFAQAIVGVEPPPIGKPLSTWIGTKPTLSTNVTGTVTVQTNGTGLLGNKYLAGNTGYRAGANYGGFIETSEPYFDTGTEQLDPNDKPVDMGKYLTIWMTPEIFQPALGVNNNLSYVNISPASYAAFRDQLNISESPTNKFYSARQGVLTGRLNRSQQADLNEMRLTFAKEDFNGIKVVDGPSAALPSSDYTRQGTIEIVQFIDTVLRTVADPFIGRNISSEEEVALQKELEESMNAMISSRVIRNGTAKLIITPVDRILGQGNVAVAVQAPFELQRLVFTVNLRKGN